METRSMRRSERPASVAERRAALRVLQHWRLVSGSRPFPSRGDIDPVAIAADWKNCFILDLTDRADGPRFLYLGPALRGAGWNDRVGRRLSDCPPGTILSLATSHANRVLETRLPVSHGGSATHDGHPVLFRSILLPLSEDGEAIDALLGSATFRRLEQSRRITVEDTRS